ncbi:CHAD domain-containing protein [Gemmatimonas sp.]|jgi:CYTH domain-containing protein/CHAD domain-containing protein|uniref:CHAD domain-containing protein n=1 Tax=Gemmatimonas sp. TaxID=1962908 RepID=UPI0037BECE50
MTDPRILSANDVKQWLTEALRRPAQEGARLMALHWLHQLAATRAAWQQQKADHAATELPALDGAARSNATERLHKARVALRRLRATARENNRVLDGTFDRKVSRALRNLGQATNAARDADVQRGWLEAEQESLPADARHEARRLLDQLVAESDADTTHVEAAFVQYFDSVADRLAARLGRYRMLRQVGVETTPLPFAHHLATRLDRAGTRLRRDIERIGDVQAQEAMHAVRIRLKRQRAVLAPFARTRPAIGAWFELASRGQDLLGAIRDTDLLARRARKAKLPALEAALRDIVLGHYMAFRHDWCDRLDDVLRTLEAAAQALRAEGSPVSLNGLPMEIERKYLLRGCPPVARAVPPVRIEQGWIPGQALRERLRRRYAPDGSVSCWRTVKLGPAEARIEVEEATPTALFDAMWPLTRDARIRKDRHAVPHGSHIWEIDVFLDRDLVLAEVELGAVSDQVTIPPWLAPYVECDVTGDPAYFNAVMARPEP